MNCRQTTTVQVALAGPGTLVTLVTLVVATSCTLLLERKLRSADSKRSPKVPLEFSVCPATILKPQEAFRQLSKAVAVACVMSAAKDQVVTRIPDATPVQDIRFFEWFLGTLYPNIVAWGSEQ